MAASPQDFRRVTEPELLDAIRGGQALALAEAYHRVVPAGHAVARRLMAGAGEVEDVLLEVFTQLWRTPPVGAPLEGWVRRTTWGVAADLLRRSGTAPSSPSASGLLPDLPAPDVRFLDAAERAISELPDDERRALLLAHDKGVASDAQDPGASDALVRALLALAGPETSSSDRAALHEDGCDNLVGLGDWCLGVADSATAARVEEAIAERPGCAAKSRAVRRGRRRVEGLPATPDMGQRILVSILTAGGGPVAAAAPAAAPTPGEAPLTGLTGLTGVEADGPGEAVPVGGTPDPAMADPAAADPAAGPVAAAEPDAVDPAMVDPAAGPVAAEPDPAAVDPFAADAPTEAGPAALDPTGPLEPVPGASGAAAPGADAPTGPLEPVADPTPPTDGPTDDGIVAAAGADAMADTADLPASGLSPETGEPAGPPPEHADWAPQPGDTSEMRLSDILAGEDEDDDDPFAALDEPDPVADPTPASPYAALQDLDGQPAPAAPSAPTFGGPVTDDGPAPFVTSPDTEVFVEGQELPPAEPVPARGGGGLAAVLLSWILPILGGAALGILLAVQVLGPPS